MPFDERTGIDFPIYQKDLFDLFGEPTDPECERTYMRTMDFREFASQFAHVRDYTGAPWSCKIYGNYVLDHPLRRAFGFLVERGLAGELETFDGCYNVRKMKGGSGYSVHSWGLAVDFNAAENPFGGQVTFSNEFIRCFADAGFESGALWRTKDGMHQQICWTKDWRGSDNPLAPIPWQA